MKTSGDAVDTADGAAADLEKLKIRAKQDDDDSEKRDTCTDMFGPTIPREDCPICMVTLPICPTGSTYKSCCGNFICCGCSLENAKVVMMTNIKNACSKNGRTPLNEACAFCRTPVSKSHEEFRSRLEKRMEMDDGNAFFSMAGYFRKGENDVQKDECKAFELYLRGADLGCAEACYTLSVYYSIAEASERVVEVDEGKERVYLEKVAKMGHPIARHNLGASEARNGDMELAVQHWLIAAAAGLQECLDVLKMAYKEGHVSKDDFAQALRSFKTAQDEEKSEERDRFAEKEARGKRQG